MEKEYYILKCEYLEESRKELNRKIDNQRKQLFNLNKAYNKLADTKNIQQHNLDILFENGLINGETYLKHTVKDIVKLCPDIDFEKLK